MTVVSPAAMGGTGGFAGRLWCSMMALLILIVPVASAATSKPACELLTGQEIAKALGAAVTIDPSASGPDPNGGDNCVWVTTDHRNVMVRVIPVRDPNFVLYTFKSEVSNAFSGGKPPETLVGVADEAKYRDYEGTLKGGVVVARKGSIVFVVEGGTSRGNLIDLTKILLSRL